MFWQMRYQTGELMDVVTEMKKGNIPCMDVDNPDILEWTLKELEKLGVYKVEGAPCDKNARDRVKEPEFEFRVAFCTSPVKAGEFIEKDYMYIDFYYEPDVEKTYDPVAEL